MDEVMKEKFKNIKYDYKGKEYYEIVINDEKEEEFLRDYIDSHCIPMTDLADTVFTKYFGGDTSIIFVTDSYKCFDVLRDGIIRRNTIYIMRKLGIKIYYV